MGSNPARMQDRVFPGVIGADAALFLSVFHDLC
jgi:hypothetical protein